MAWRFGDFTLDGERRQLLRAGIPLSLEPKAYELLGLLLARRPRALSKDQIHGVLWAGTFVSESALPGLVADLRSVLGDDARRPRFIRTVHGYGYAFCGEAREDGEPRVTPTEPVLRALVLSSVWRTPIVRTCVRRFNRRPRRARRSGSSRARVHRGLAASRPSPAAGLPRPANTGSALAWCLRPRS